MKKLISIITALTVTMSVTTNLISCKILTNKFEIKILNSKSIREKVKYAFNKNEGQYLKKNGENIGTDDDIKTALESSKFGWTSTMLNQLINILFFNANLSVLSNKTKSVWQYVFNTGQDNIFADGQYRTAGIDENKNKIKEYYATRANISIGSILGLYNLSKYASEIVFNNPKLDQKTLEIIHDMYNSSNNQGITKISINNELNIIKGKIGVGEEVNIPTTKINNNVEKLKNWVIKKYDYNYISKETNYNQEFADKGAKGYKDIVLGDAIYDPFSQLLISNLADNQLANKKEIKVRQVEKSDYFHKNHKLGEILNSKANKYKDIIFEYVWDSKNKKATAINTYGYNLIALDDLNLTILFNDNLKLKESKPIRNNYTINIKVSGLQAAFTPILEFLVNDVKKNNKLDSNSYSGKPYVGWKFAGYQFNDTNIFNFKDDGTVMDKSDLPIKDKNLNLKNKYFKDLNISEFKIKKN